MRDDSDFIRLKDQLLAMISDIIEDEGYVLHLDLSPEFSTWYIEEEKCYGFKLSLYGIEAGEDENCTQKKMGYSEGKFYKI